MPDPVVHFAFEGYAPSGDLIKEIRRAWEEGVFDQQRTSEAIRLIRQVLVKDGRLQSDARADAAESADGAEKRVVFRIDPGPRYASVEWIYKGASAILPRSLPGTRGCERGTRRPP